MSVASWLRSQFTTQDPTTYKSAIDGNFAVLERVAAMFAAQQAATPNMTVVLRAGSIMDAGSLVEVAQQTTAPFAAPVSTSRIDRIVLDERTGVYSVVAGTPSGSPVAPAILAGKLPCAQVLLQSTSTAITNSMITDERVFGSASQAILTAIYAPVASPAFTGIPTAPTAAPLNSSTQLATTAYVDLAATAATFASGTRMPFNQTAAPTGWTKDTTAALNDTAMRIVTGTVGSGGTQALSTAAITATSSGNTTNGHALTIAELASHTHGELTSGGNVIDVGGTTTTAYIVGSNASSNSGIGTQQQTSAQGGGTAHSHSITFSAVGIGIKYNDFIIATKN